MRRLWFSGLVVCVSFAVAQPGQVEFKETDFDATAGKWVQVTPTPTSGPGGQAIVTWQSFGGNPGSWFKIELDINDGGTKTSIARVAAVLINTTARYSPAVSGPISSLDYSESVVNPAGSTVAGQYIGPVLRQDGRIFVRPGWAGTAGSAWKDYAATGMKATDLVELVGSSAWLNYASHPDFSASGTLIEFGFWHENESTGSLSTGIPGVKSCDPYDYYCLPTSSGPLVSTMGIDNWFVRLHTEPSTFVTSTDRNVPNSALAGDPVSTATGELILEETDLSSKGPLALQFVRYYGSLLQANGISSALGKNWMHNFDVKLTGGGSSATMLLFGGKKVDFVLSGSAWQTAHAEKYPYQLVSVSGGFQFLDAESMLIYSFGPQGGPLVRIEDRNGNALSLTQSTTGPTQVSDGLGRTLSFTYSGDKLTKVQDASGRTVTFTYSGNDLTAVTDAANQTSRYSYTVAGSAGSLLVSKTLPAGNTPQTQSFDAQGRVIRQTDSRGSTMSIAYDRPSAYSSTVTDALSQTNQHVYRMPGNIASYVDPAGQSVALTYDAANRITSLTDRLGDKSSVTYDPVSGYAASITDAQGNTTKYAYTAQQQGRFTFYNLTQVTFADGGSLSFTYDASGNLIGAKDQNGGAWTYTYNSRGQVLTAKDPAGGTTSFAYNADGTVRSQQSPSGDVTNFIYDSGKRLSQINYADGTSRAIAWDKRDNVVLLTNELGGTVQISYDSNGRLQSATGLTGYTGTAALDTNDRLTSLTDSSGRTVSAQLDDLGRLKTIKLPTGDPVNLGFDTTNHLTSVTDCSGKGFQFMYDREGVFSSVSDGLGRTWSFTSDKNGRITRIQSPLARRFDYRYDAKGLLVSSTSAAGEVTTYRRDAIGNIIGVSAAGPLFASLQRDAMGRLVSIGGSTGNPRTFAYDAQGRVSTATGALSRVTSYQYDQRNRITAVVTPENSGAFTYDKAGNLIRSLYSDGVDVQFQYDNGNRLIQANGLTRSYDASGSITASNGLTIGRDAVDRITSVNYAADKPVQYRYDCRGLLVEVKDWIGGSFAFNYDDARQLIFMSRPNGTTTAYTYDLDGRLTGITENSGDTVLSSIALQRDAAGRITAADRAGPPAPDPPEGSAQFTYDASNQRADGTYDRNGRPTSVGTRNFTWDAASRLTSYSDVNGAVSFTYNAIGQRVSRIAGALTQSYVWNDALLLPAVSVLRQDGKDLCYYVYLPDGTLLESIDADGTRRSFHFDEMGSTTMLTVDDGTISDTYAITPYGESVAHTGSTENAFTFLGAWGVMQEGNTDLYYARNRYYDSSAARFLTPGAVQGLTPKTINLYQYATGNPAGYIDPLGGSGTARLVQNRVENGLTAQVAFSLRKLLASGNASGPKLIVPMLRIIERLSTGRFVRQEDHSVESKLLE